VLNLVAPSRLIKMGRLLAYYRRFIFCVVSARKRCERDLGSRAKFNRGGNNASFLTSVGWCATIWLPPWKIVRIRFYLRVSLGAHAQKRLNASRPQTSTYLRDRGPIMDSQRLWSRLFMAVFCLASVGVAQDQTRAQVAATDEAALRAFAEQFFGAYARKDLDGFMKLWSAKATGLEARRQEMQERFASTDKIELKSLAIRNPQIEGSRARLLVTVEMSALDVKTGKAAEGFGKMDRALHLVKEVDGWRASREMASGEALAAMLAAAKTDEERARLLAANKNAITFDLRMALHFAGTRQRVAGDFAGSISTHTLELWVAQQVDDKLGISSAAQGIAIASAELGDYSAAVENFQKSLAIAEQLGSQVNISAALNNLGIVCRRQGNYNLALQYYQKALSMETAIARKVGVAYAMNNIGNIYYYQGNYTLAMEYFRKSLAVKEDLNDKDSYNSSLMNIANVYYAQDDYPKAIEYYRKARVLAEEAGNKLSLADILDNLASANVMQGDYNSANENYQKSLALFESIGHKFGVAEVLLNIGFLSNKQRDYQKALQMAEHSAAIAREIGSREHLWQARTVAGKAYRALSQPDQARAAFDEAIAVTEAIRADAAGGAQEQQGFFENKVSAYRAMVDLLIAQNQFDEALRYAERAKARALLDVVSSGSINVTKAMTPAEREQERSLDGKLFSLNSQISRETSRPHADAARVAAIKADLQKARLDREAFHTALYAAHPELKVRRGQAQPITMQEAAALLPDADSALLEYVVTEEKTYLFVLTPEHRTGGGGPAEVGLRINESSADSVVQHPAPRLMVYTIDIKSQALTERAEAFRQQLARRDLRFSSSAIALYDLLIKPARQQLQGKKFLLIVPDAALWQFPFQALQSAQNHYLLEDTAIAYAPSLTVLREMTRLRKRPSAQPGALTLLAVGNPSLGHQTLERLKSSNRDEKLEPLPEAEREARALGRMYGSDHSKVYVGGEAREDRIKSEAAKFTVLHLATHGILDDASPMYSHLVLAQSEAPSGEANAGEDGLLEAWEMMNLDLQAELVVLSACETARGRVAEGEGVIGMSWALFVAGCPTAMVSQWKVDSASTTELMLAFHKELQNEVKSKGQFNAAQSLRKAAIGLLHGGEYVHPFYWAGFVVVGAWF
jgi:CHAT domain-containing protein